MILKEWTLHEIWLAQLPFTIKVLIRRNKFEKLLLFDVAVKSTKHTRCLGRIKRKFHPFHLYAHYTLTSMEKKIPKRRKNKLLFTMKCLVPWNRSTIRIHNKSYSNFCLTLLPILFRTYVFKMNYDFPSLVSISKRLWCLGRLKSTNASGKFKFFAIFRVFFSILLVSMYSKLLHKAYFVTMSHPHAQSTKI